LTVRRIVVCVMLMGSGEMIALQTSFKRFPKIPFAYKRASGPFS